jgi:hypothetical protein
MFEIDILQLTKSQIGAGICAADLIVRPGMFGWNRRIAMSGRMLGIEAILRRQRDGSHVIVEKKVDLIRPLPGAGSAREAACGPFPLPLQRRRGAKNRLWLHPRDTRLETAEFCVRNRSGSLLLHQPAAQLLTARVIGWPKMAVSYSNPRTQHDRIFDQTGSGLAVSAHCGAPRTPSNIGRCEGGSDGDSGSERAPTTRSQRSA